MPLAVSNKICRVPMHRWSEAPPFLARSDDVDLSDHSQGENHVLYCIVLYCIVLYCIVYVTQSMIHCADIPHGFANGGVKPKIPDAFG